MAGIDKCLDYIEKEHEKNFTQTCKLIASFRERLKSLKYIDVGSQTDTADPFKAVIRSKSRAVSGRDLYIGLLEDYHIQCEMYASDYALAFFSEADKRETFSRLEAALRAMDDKYEMAGLKADRTFDKNRISHIPESVMTPGIAMSRHKTDMSFGDELIGQVCGTYVSIYPPGIPIVIPGEVIDDKIISQIEEGMENGLNITGMKGSDISVIDDNE